MFPGIIDRDAKCCLKSVQMVAMNLKKVTRAKSRRVVGFHLRKFYKDLIRKDSQGLERISNGKIVVDQQHFCECDKVDKQIERVAVERRRLVRL